jgi:hypothetical protein
LQRFEGIVAKGSFQDGFGCGHIRLIIMGLHWFKESLRVQ